jgi:hypothetical protein
MPRLGIRAAARSSASREAEPMTCAYTSEVTFTEEGPRRLKMIACRSPTAVLMGILALSDVGARGWDSRRTSGQAHKGD